MRLFGDGYAEVTRVFSVYAEAKFAELCGCPKYAKSGEMDPDTLEMVSAKCPRCGATKTWEVNKDEKARIAKQTAEIATAMESMGRACARGIDEEILSILKGSAWTGNT